MQEKDKNGILEGTIWKQLLIFFFPILIGTFFQQLYNTVDSVIVGQFAGKEALSSVGGSAGQIINMIVGFFTGLSTGATVLLSQYFGAGKKEDIHKALHTAYAFSIIGGIVFGVLGIIAAPSLLRLMNTPEELIYNSTAYLRIYFAGLVFVFIYNIGAAILRAIGDSKRPLYYLIVCCFLNIILDLLFVVGLGLNVLGVAVATLIAQAVSACFITYALMRKTKGLQLNLRDVRLHGKMLRVMLQVGLPMGIQSSMYNVSNAIVQTALNGFGVDTMAAWTAFGKIDSIFWMINSAFGIAVTTFVGQNYGAGKWERVRKGTKVCLCMAIVTALTISALLMFGGSFFFGIFTADEAVVEIGLRMMNLISPTYFLFVFIEILSGSLRAQGSVVITTIISITGICLFRIVWITVITVGGTLEEIIACYPVTWLVSAVAIIIYYTARQRALRKRKNLVKSVK